MLTHQQKIDRVSRKLKERKSTSPVSFKKKSVAHQVPWPGDKRLLDEKIDLSDLNQILSIDPENKVCVAEPGITFVDLVKATLKYNLVPFLVPELKTITIGGAVAGGSIESMSYKYGGFHDSCLEYEVITATGEILICTPDNENQLLFQMMNGTFGTLGVISKLKFKLIAAKPFVKVEYVKYNTLESYQQATWQHYQDKDVDFMDGIIHSPDEYVLSLANFVDHAPYTHNYDWMRVYYKTTNKRKEDYLTTADYFFRYEKGVTNVTVNSFLGRLFFGKFVNSTSILWLAQKFQRFIPADKIPVTCDLLIPFSNLKNFFNWYNSEINFYPLWYVPYKVARDYEWATDEFLTKTNDDLYADIAIYGMHRNDGKNYYKMLEDKLLEIGGMKPLITGNYYSESEFWRTWNKENYFKVKNRVDPNNIFRDLYTKTCKAMMGAE